MTLFHERRRCWARRGQAARRWPSLLGCTTSHMTSSCRKPGSSTMTRWNTASRNETLCGAPGDASHARPCGAACWLHSTLEPKTGAPATAPAAEGHCERTQQPARLGLVKARLPARKQLLNSDLLNKTRLPGRAYACTRGATRARRPGQGRREPRSAPAGGSTRR